MGTEITTQRATAFLTLHSMKARKEADLSDEQFAELERIASAPVPQPAPAEWDKVREVLAVLAASLKAPRTSLDAGKLKLRAYRVALEGKGLEAIQRAARYAVQELEWLPTPSELAKLCDSYITPEQHLHTIARRMVGDRRQRLHDEALRRIERKELSPDELQSLPRYLVKAATARGDLLTMPDGSIAYRTPETLASLEAHSMEWRGDGAPHERITHAGAEAGAVRIGDAVDDFLSGLEAFDGEA